MTGRLAIPADLIASARRTLSRDRLVRRRLPGWGRVHIDRRQPFLCVYRRPPDRADVGTETLPLSQASYLLATGEKEAQSSLQTLIEALVAELSDAFGRVVLLELWSAGGSGGENGRPPFRIVAPSHHAPQETLEALEAALLATEWPGDGAKIAVAYERAPAPPDLPPLLPAAAAERLGCTSLGLEIPALYREDDGGPLYPNRLRALRHDLGHVLKQTFFAFSHSEATARPAHYHELGRRAMTRVVGEVDRQLSDIGDAFDLLLMLTPTNAETAWHEFERSRFQHRPEFHYRPRTVDPAALKRRLYAIPVESIEDPALHAFFESKRDELDRQLTMVADRGTPRVLYGSLQLYGAAEPSLIEQARTILAKVPPHTHDDAVSDYVDAAAFARHAEAEIERLRGAMPDLPATVQIRDDVPGLLVSRGHLLIGQEAHVARARIEATIQHEVGTHIVTYYNGRAQPFRQLHAGTAGYEALQEGIAVLAEYLVGGLSRPRLRLLAGRVLAADHVAHGAAFVETFRMLHDDHAFNRKTAYTVAMRVYRGGGFTKDLVYLRGLVGLLQKLAEGIPLADLLLGKIALEDLDLLEELVWRKVLKPAPLRPAYLDDPQAQARLDRIVAAKQTGVLDLIVADTQ